MGSAWAADLNPIALLWTLLALPFFAIVEVLSVRADRRALRRNGVLTDLSQRHWERAIGRVILLTLVMLIGLASLLTPFVPPNSPRGWLILVGLLLLPAMIQADGIRDHQLRRRVMRTHQRGR